MTTLTDVLTAPVDSVLLDVDGTMIDSSYHMAVAWSRAFDDHGLHCEMWQIHRTIGMGGDHLVAHLTSQDVEDRLGDQLRDGWEEHYLELVDEVRAVDGAKELVLALRKAGLKVALASSSPEKLTEKALEMLGLTTDDFDAVTTSSDADSAKPDPDILQVALDRVGGKHPVVIGDSTWDVEAAKGIDAKTITVRSGGFGADELTEAGAVLVVDTVKDLVDADWSSLVATA